jgi:hypothetical protein
LLRRNSIIGVFLAFVIVIFTTVTSASGVLVNVPTADLTKDGRLTFGFRDIGKVGIAEVSWGVSPDVAAAVSIIKKGANPETFNAGVKVKLVGEAQEYPALSFGLSRESMYLVASKSLGLRAPRIHAGIGQGRVNGVFAGLSYVVNPVTISSGDKSLSVPVAMVMGEYDGRSLNAGVRLVFSPRFDLDVYLVGMEELGWGLKFNTQF